MTRKQVLSLFLGLFFNISILQGQLQLAERLGAQLGISFSMGTHFNRLGLIAKFYYEYEHVQANLHLAGYYNPRSFATGIPSWEGQLRLGLVGTWGPKDQAYFNPFLKETSNQTSRPFSVGYSYNFYWDNQATSQCSGSFGLGVYGFSLLMENDFLAFRDQDKYRTGGMTLGYQFGDTEIRISNLFWTADPYDSSAAVVKDNPNFEAPYGYCSMSKAKYLQNSVGLLAISVEQRLPYGQYLGASVGIDAEQIRNEIQNKFIHESKLLENPHIPMIDTKGKEYLYEKDQKIRAAKLFIELFANRGALY